MYDSLLLILVQSVAICVPTFLVWNLINIYRSSWSGVVVDKKFDRGVQLVNYVVRYADPKYYSGYSIFVKTTAGKIVTIYLLKDEFEQVAIGDRYSKEKGGFEAKRVK